MFRLEAANSRKLMQLLGYLGGSGGVCRDIIMGIQSFLVGELVAMRRLEHTNLIKIMQSLGYHCKDDGVCHGVAMMGIQSFLVGELAIFNDRLNFIAAHPDLHAAIIRVKEKLARESLFSMSPKKLNLNEEEQKLIDTLAFFDGINLYQHPLNYPVCLGSSVTQFHTDIISNIAQSTQLERKGGLIKVMSWPGIYNDSELERYVRFLDEIAAKLNHSFSMLIGSDNHSVVILYDHVTARWQVLDANQLPVVSKDITQLAAWIKKALIEYGKMTVFESSIYLPGDAVYVAQRLDAVIKQSPEFVSLHAITEHKKNASNSRNVTLAYIAACNGYVEVIKALCDAGADLNQARNDGATPAFIAAQDGHADVIKVLHQAGVDLNQARNNGATLAFVAAHNGYTNVLVALEAANVDLRIRTPFGTPLEIAIRMNHTDCINFLTDYTKRKSSQHNAAFFQNQCHEQSQGVQLSSSNQGNVRSGI